MRRLLFFHAVAMPLLFISCAVQKQVSEVSDQTLFTIGNQVVSKEEFKYAFLKNYRPNDSISVEKEIADYLNLYVNFKLKVKEARARNYHQRTSYINELKSYQKDLAKPYLTENKVTEALIEEAYERLKSEVKASHILIGINGDSTAAKAKVKEIKRLAESGLSFDSLATQYSEDPSAKRNGGNLGYFSALQMVYPFESAAYDTPVGGISDVVTTRFGYHLLKVYDKRPAQGQVRVAHIMLRRSPSDSSLQAQTDLKRKIEAIHQEAINGKDWNELSRDFSQDTRSKDKGGELPWLSTGNFIPSFEKEAFSLQKVGEISRPFETIYGWHIVKLLEKKGLGKFEEVKDEISTKIKRDSRSASKNKQVISKLKKDNNYRVYQEVVDTLLAQLDEKGTTSLDQTTSLFSLLGKNFNVGDFLAFLNESKKKNLDYPTLYNQFEEKSILAFESEQLEVKYPDYANLLNEYRDGILLFDIMQEEVWGKASQDTVGLEKFYDQQKSNYTKKNVKEVIIYSSAEKQAISRVKQLIQEDNTEKEIMEKINHQSPLTLQSSTGLYEQGDYDLVDQCGDQAICEQEKNDRHYLIQSLHSYDSLTPQLEDIQGKLISDFQDQLEENWVAKLKVKYPVEINQNTVREVVNEIRKQ